jgi:Mannosyltransferase (PIG-V)
MDALDRLLNRMASLAAVPDRLIDVPLEHQTVASGTTRQAWQEAVKVAVWVRIAFFSVAFAANWSVAVFTGQQRPGFFDVWLKWDAIAFLLVAQHGYTSPLTHPTPTAYFPLLPLLLRALVAIDVPGASGGLLISGVASVVAFAYLYKLAEEQVGPASGRAALLYLALFPSAVFLVAGYSEAIFLAGAIPAFYYARRRQWGLAALPTALATAARFAGIFLIVGLAIELFQQRREPRWIRLQAASALAIGCIPLVAYGLFLDRARGDPLYYFTDQRVGWHRGLSNPVTSLINTFSRPEFVIETLSAAVGVFLVVWVVRRRQWSYAAYMGTSLASLMTSTSYISISRILVSFFPVPLLLAARAKDHPRAGAVILAISTTLALTGVVAFTHGLGFY